MFQSAKRFLATLSFVTCLPALSPNARRQGEPSQSPDLSGLAKYLSAVGLLLGLILCLCNWLLLHLNINSLLCASILVAAWLVLTNGFHFDGLMDTADGIFSHQPIKKTLEIMSDSRVGNYGVMTGMLVFWLKTASLASISQPAVFASLLLAPIWSRWCASFAMGKFPYLKESGMGKIWHDTMQYPKDLALGAIVPLLASAPALYFLACPTTLSILGSLSFGLLASLWFAKKLGGHTGDTYGAVVELAELGGVLITALFLK